ncbi:MAG: helix-turn-helix transcriptional regulator [Anaerolineae bacterium]|nr:helix-turn-helix transcriptional regulator [Anaerolineae bacterium]
MQDVFYIEAVEQAAALLHPTRIELLKRMATPRSCPDLAAEFDTTPQKIYYHVKALEKADLVVKVEERKVRGVNEGQYQARAKSYWLAPSLVGQVGGERVSRDQSSLRFLLSLTEEVQRDIGHLGQRSEVGESIPSLGLSAQIYLPDGDRRADFLRDVQTLFQDLATRYGLPPDEVGSDLVSKMFRLILACYPAMDETDR